MVKITAKDYIDAKDDLAKIGFMSVKEMTKQKKTITEISNGYGVAERSVELVKTINSYEEYQTVRRLEKEREELEAKIAERDKLIDAKKESPKSWHYAVAIIILVMLAVFIGWAIINLFGWIGGLF